MKTQCTQCGSDDIQKSRLRGIERILLHFLPLAPYRCKECWVRFWAFRNPLQSPSSRIVVGILVLFFVLSFVLSQKGKAPIPDGEGVRKAAVRRPIIREGRSPVAIVRPDQKGYAGTKEENPERVLPSGAGDPVELAAAESLKGTGNDRAGERKEPERLLPVPPAALEEPAERAPDKTLSQAESPAPVTERRVERASAGGKAYLNLLAVALQTSGRESRVVLSADAPIKGYESFFIGTPPRFVIDLAGRWVNQGPSELNLKSDKVRGVRVGEHHDKLRIVIDLEGGKPIYPTIEESPREITLILR